MPGLSPPYNARLLFTEGSSHTIRWSWKTTIVPTQSVIRSTALRPEGDRDKEFGVKVDGNEIPQELDPLLSSAFVINC